MRSVRTRIALAMALLALLATSLVGAIGYRSTSTRLLAEVDRSIVEATNLLARSGNGPVRVPNRGVLGIYSVRLIGRGGQVVNGSFDDDVPVTDGARAVVGVDGGYDRSTVTVDGDRLRIHTVGGEAGALQIARPLGESDRVLDDVRRRTVLLVVAVSLLAASAGWMLAGSVAAPLRRLTRAATDVERSGDLAVDIPPGGADEVGRLGQAFQSMLDALRRSQSEQRRLVQDAGHELRTPLTSLRTNLAVLRRHPDLDAETRARIHEDLEAEIAELTLLVNEVVAAGSGDAADEEVQDVDLAAVVGEVAERVARRRGRVVDVDVDHGVGSDGIVRVPRQAIERAITNLLENAAKFDESEAPIEVTVRHGSVTVADRGPGIAPDDLPLVFDRFHRAESARSLPGSGLGLSIVRDVVERHGGTVRAANRDGGGACVGFDLPPVR